MKFTLRVKDNQSDKITSLESDTLVGITRELLSLIEACAANDATTHAMYLSDQLAGIAALCVQYLDCEEMFYHHYEMGGDGFKMWLEDESDLAVEEDNKCPYPVHRCDTGELVDAPVQEES